MGKQTSALILRYNKTEDWLAKYYCDNFNYSHLSVQDSLIREYVINFISCFNTKLAQIFIYREKDRVIVRIFSYNDSFTNWKSFLSKRRKKIRFRYLLLDKQSKEVSKLLDFKKSNFYYNSGSDSLFKKQLFFRNKKKVDSIFFKSRNKLSYSGKRLLGLNLSYLINNNVIIKNTNIISNNQRNLLLRIFSPMGLHLRSPLSKYLRVKFICLVYYSLLYRSSLLLCRYLRFIIPRFCKKKRKNRKINPFLKSLNSVIDLMFTNNFCKHASVKGIKILFKGRINGIRRKRTYLIKRGYTSTQSFSNYISYHQEDCLTIFGILGIKVWIIY